jgi:uncharacterized protein YdiU (UPF0061 family)
MIVHWMRVGFVHGVMNTDNMSILGLTIDYGPYGWLEDYDPTWTPNTTDASQRRYRFENQPGIAHWNLYQLANSVVQVTQDPKPLEQSLEDYNDRYGSGYQSMMASKLGLNAYQNQTDEDLIGDLVDLLSVVETDMTIFFRNLADLSARSDESKDVSDDALVGPIRDAWYTPDKVDKGTLSRTAGWLRRYQDRVRTDATTDAVRKERMNRVNPKYVLRNYIAQLAIDKSEKGDHSLVRDLLDVLRRPYDEQPGREEHAQKRPDWARERAGCSMLSCSS